MTTLEHSWRERGRNGYKIVSNKTGTACENPFISKAFGDLLDDCAPDGAEEYEALAYLIEEHVDAEGVAEALEAMSDEERREMAVAVEARKAEERNQRLGAPTTSERMGMDK